MAKSEDKGVDGYSYTGNWEGSYEPYRDGTVSASSVAEASLTSQDNGEVYVTFSVPNTTNDNWAGCLVNYDVLYKGMYAGSLNASYDAAVQPGENAAPTGDLNDLPLYGYVGANVNPDILGGKIELIVTNVTYDSSQTTEN